MRRSMVAGALAVCHREWQDAPRRRRNVWKGRRYIAVDGGAQASSSDFSSTVPFTLRRRTFDAYDQVRVIFAGRRACGSGGTWRPAWGCSSARAARRNQAAAASVFFQQVSRVTGARPADPERSRSRPRSQIGVVEEDGHDAVCRTGVLHPQADLAASWFTEVYPFDTATFTGVESKRSANPSSGSRPAPMSYCSRSRSPSAARSGCASSQLSPAGGPTAPSIRAACRPGAGLRLR